jgi:hypothetical protein
MSYGGWVTDNPDVHSPNVAYFDEDDGVTPTIKCSRCSTWQHRKCVVVHDSNPGRFVCNACTTVLSEGNFNNLALGLFMKGVTLLEKHPVFGGGFSDIFRASYQGKEVALKRMRVFEESWPLQSFNKVVCLTATHFDSISDVFHHSLGVLSRGIDMATS